MQSGWSLSGSTHLDNCAWFHASGAKQSCPRECIWCFCFCSKCLWRTNNIIHLSWALEFTLEFCSSVIPLSFHIAPSSHSCWPRKNLYLIYVHACVHEIYVHEMGFLICCPNLTKGDFHGIQFCIWHTKLLPIGRWRPLSSARIYTQMQKRILTFAGGTYQKGMCVKLGKTNRFISVKKPWGLAAHTLMPALLVPPHVARQSLTGLTVLWWKLDGSNGLLTSSIWNPIYGVQGSSSNGELKQKKRPSKWERAHEHEKRWELKQEKWW